MNAGALLCSTLRRDGAPSDEAILEAWERAPLNLAALVQYEEAALWLSRRLAERGGRDRLPAAVRSALRDQVLVAAGNGLRIEAEARAVLERFERAGIPAIPLKGAARRILATRWPVLAARPLGDVDLLLPPDATREGWELLRRAGYELALPGSEAHYREHHHLPGLIGPGKVSIELHRSALPALPPQAGWRRYWESSEVVSWQGLEVRVPGPTELAWHAISHAATDGVLGFRLRHLVDLVGLVESRAAIDWRVIAMRVADEPVLDGLTLSPTPVRVLRQWLGAVAELLGPDAAAPLAGTAEWVDLAGLLEGRARLLGSRLGRRRRLRSRLLAEWTRSHLGWSLEPVSGTLWHRARGGASGLLARGACRILAGTMRRRRRGGGSVGSMEPHSQTLRTE